MTRILSEEFLYVFAASGFEPAGWQPRVDVYRCDYGLLVKAELPGVRAQDIGLSVTRDTLVIEGRRSDWLQQGMREVLSMEIAYDRFRRVLRLPLDLSAARIATEYRDGMLLIELQTEGGRA